MEKICLVNERKNIIGILRDTKFGVLTLNLVSRYSFDSVGLKLPTIIVLL